MIGLKNKKNIWTILLSGLVLVFCLVFFIPPVFASNVVDQQGATSAQSTTPGTDALGQSFIPIQNNFSQWKMYTACAIGDYASTTVDWYLCSGDLASTNGVFQLSYTCGNIGNSQIYASSTVITCNSNNTVDNYLIPNTAQQLVPGINYYISWKPRTSHLKYSYISSATNYYANGFGMPPGASANTDYTFSEYYDNTFATSSPSTANIIFSNPQNGLTYKDFFNWQLDYSISATGTASSTYNITIKYGTATSTTEWTDSEDVPLVNGTTRWAITKKHSFVNGSYYAMAYLYQDSNLLAYSPQIGFIINNTTGVGSIYGYESPRFTPASNLATASSTNCNAVPVCQGLDTGTIAGYTECAYRGAINWAMCPSLIAQFYVEEKIGALKSVFPFNAYFQLTNTVQDALATSTSMNGSLGVPMIRRTATSTEYYITSTFSSSTIPRAVGSSNATMIRNTIGWAMWITLGVYIFLTLKTKPQ